MTVMCLLELAPCVCSASAAAAPLCISPVSRGSSVKSGEEVPQGQTGQKNKKNSTSTYAEFLPSLSITELQVWRGTQKQHSR